MDGLLWTTPWGAGYLALLAATMLPAMLFLPASRYLAMAMVGLFICDRLAVNQLPDTMALFFLAFAYLLVAVAIVFTHQGKAAAVVGVCLVLTSIAFITGGFGIVDWDAAGTVQEVAGVIAMTSIVVRRKGGGGLSHARIRHDRPVDRGHRAAGVAHSHRRDRH